MTTRHWIIAGALAGPVVGGALIWILTVVAQAYPVVGVIVGLSGAFALLGAGAGYTWAESRKRTKMPKRKKPDTVTHDGPVIQSAVSWPTLWGTQRQDGKIR